MRDINTLLIKYPTVIVAISGIFVTIILYWLGTRRNRMDTTFKLIEMLQEKDTRNARFSLREILALAADQAKGFDGLKSEDRATISSIALLFGFAGSLARRRRIYSSIFLDSFASSIVLNHMRLSDYAAWRRSIRPTAEGSLWKYFDWLAAKARRFISIQSEPSRFRRLLLTFGLIPLETDSIAKLAAEADQRYRIVGAIDEQI